MANRYKIKGKIGRGGAGAIYHAYDDTLKRDVVIKRLLPIEETQLNNTAMHSLTREVDALSRLQHPNVINLFAFEEDEEGPYVVMEYIEGNTLKDVVSHGAMGLDDFIVVANQTLDPLVTAQEHGLLHRDIKPDNIMLQWLSSGSFQVKILDFGLAKFSHTPSLQTLDQTGAFLGSIDYLAPEQLERQLLDPRTDLYSLGCVLYYCLAQRSPFEGDTPAATMSNHLNHVVFHISEIRQDVPQAIAEWLMLLIARRPDKRPKNAKEALRLFTLARNGEVPQISCSILPADSSINKPSRLIDSAACATAPVSIGPPSKSPVVYPSAKHPMQFAPSEISGPVLPPAKRSLSPSSSATHISHTPASTKRLTTTEPIVIITKRFTAKIKALSRFHPVITQSAQSPVVWTIAVMAIIILFLTGYLIEEKYHQENRGVSTPETSLDKVVISSDIDQSSR